MNYKEFSRAAHFMVASLTVLLGLAAVLHQLQLVESLDYGGDNSPTEAETLYAVRRVGTGQKIYCHFSRPPYVLAQYTPIYYWAAGLISRVLNAGKEQTFLIGRLHAYGFWLAVGLLIYALARQAGCGRMVACMACLSWLGTELAQEWANSCRPDSSALFFSLAAIWCFLRGTPQCRIAGAILLVLAFLHKQSSVAALIAVLAYDLRQRDYRKAGLVLGIWGLLVVPVLLIFQTVTGGAFSANTLQSLISFANWRWPLYLLGCSVVLGASGFFGGALSVGLSSPLPKQGTVLQYYFISALALAFLSSFKFGSWTNYYLEPYAAGCVLMAVFVTECTSRDPTSGTVVVFSAWYIVALSLTSVTLWHVGTDAPRCIREMVNRPSIRRRQRVEWDRVTALLSQFPKPLLIEDDYMAVRCEDAPFLVNAANFARLKRQGRFDDGPIQQMIRTRQFGAIVVQFPHDDASDRSRPFPKDWLNLIGRHYEIDPQNSSSEGEPLFYVYKPRAG